MKARRNLPSKVEHTALQIVPLIASLGKSPLVRTRSPLTTPAGETIGRGIHSFTVLESHPFDCCGYRNGIWEASTTISFSMR